MKTVTIIAPDAVPLPIKREYLDSLSQQDKKDFISKQYVISNAPKF